MISTRSWPGFARGKGKGLRGKVAFLSLSLFTLPLAPSVSSDFPVYLAATPNPHDFTLFANSGWDGNWYAGYDNCWIKKLPPVPAGTYQRAYLGARLGRMKTTGPVGRPPVFPPIPGDLLMAISSTGAWTVSSGVRVASADEIPLEGHGEYAVEGTGESQWYWTEIPLSSVNRSGDNYIVLWSSASAWLSATTAPIVAAAWGGKDIDTWLCKDAGGSPPTVAKDSPGTPISYFQPALALKLIPEGPPHPVSVRIESWKNDNGRGRPVIAASVAGDSIERSWIEYFDPSFPRPRSGAGEGIGALAPKSEGRWVRSGPPRYKAPYIFTLDPRRLPMGKVRLRVGAANIWGDIGASEALTIEVGKAK